MNQELIKKISEDEHNYETTLKDTAKRIVEDERIKLVLITGGSCAGKTTTTRKLKELIDLSGRIAHTVSLDDYYRNLDESVYLPAGTRGQQPARRSDTSGLFGSSRRKRSGNTHV